MIMGQVLQGGAGQAPARQAAIGAGPADRDAGRHDQQGLRVVDPRGRDRRLDDPRRRRRRRRHRRDGVDDERAVRPQAGALRLPARRRDADRPDDARRPRRRPSTGGTWSSRRRSSRASSGSRARSRTRGRCRSHERAVAAIDAGRFDDEIVPVGDVAADESPRRDTSLEKLATLKPVFDPEGTTTAGNAPGVNDGASCVVVASEEWARRRGLEPLATIARPGLRRRRVRLPRSHAREGGRDRARAGGEDDRRRQRASRSTRRSRRSPGTRPGCSAPTRSG